MVSHDYHPELFGSSTSVLQLKDAEVEYVPNFLCDDSASTLYQQLIDETDWRQETVKVYGKEHLTPRLSCWMGDQWMDYSYSNVTMQAQPWTDTILSIKQSIEKYTSATFNSVLVNFYRDGRDSNGWHSDNEPELGIEPVIGSLSLGAARDFKLRHRFDRDLKHSMTLEHGSLLMMRGRTQSHWQHHIPKRAKAGGRINLTFRTILKTGDDI